MSLAAWQRELDDLGSATPNRIAYAAAHVVVDNENGEHVDREATDTQRTFLDQHGFGIAEAMDTAQRFELGWNVAKTLIERTAALKLKNGFSAGASADHREPQNHGELSSAVAWQVNFIRDLGGLPVILPMPVLATEKANADEFVKVYADILSASVGPVILHWLGAMFMEGLGYYFPEDSFERIMALDRDRIIGVKLSLLDADREIAIRQELAKSGQVVYTGDDFNFAKLIAGVGDQPGEYSHALLGILDAIARPAGLAFQFLSHGMQHKFLEIMNPCEKLSRHLFQNPTHHYKAGIAYLSWLDDRQSNPWLPLGSHLNRDADHFRTLFELAMDAHVFADPSFAENRAHSH